MKQNQLIMQSVKYTLKELLPGKASRPSQSPHTCMPDFPRRRLEPWAEPCPASCGALPQ